MCILELKGGLGRNAGTYAIIECVRGGEWLNRASGAIITRLLHPATPISNYLQLFRWAALVREKPIKDLLGFYGATSAR